jgi:hypothetical protein
MPSSPRDMRESIARNMQKTTGKSLEHWVGLVREQGLTKHGEIVKWLMAEHGFTRGYAGAVAASVNYEDVAPEEMVDRQYAGKESLRPIYERVLAEVESLGGAVEPRQTYVAFTNGRQFGLVQPSTKTRVDLGLVLAGEQPTDRLRDAGSFGSSRITHRVALSAPEDVDAQVRAWLSDAYARAAS